MSVEPSDEVSNRLITINTPRAFVRKPMKVLTSRGECVPIPQGNFRFVPAPKSTIQRGTTIVRSNSNSPLNGRSLLLQSAQRPITSTAAMPVIKVPSNVKLYPTTSGLMVVNLKNGLPAKSSTLTAVRPERQKHIVVQSSLLQNQRKKPLPGSVIVDKNDLRVTRNLDEPKRYRGPRESEIEDRAKCDDTPVNGVEDYLYGPSKKPRLVKYSFGQEERKPAKVVEFAAFKDLEKAKLKDVDITVLNDVEITRLPGVESSRDYFSKGSRGTTEPHREKLVGVNGEKALGTTPKVVTIREGRRKQINTPIRDFESESCLSMQEFVKEEQVNIGCEKEAINLIEWANDVGSLPGLKGLSFKINSNHLLEIVEDCALDDCNSPKKTSEELKPCANCGTWGFEFYKEKFCGRACKDETDARHLLVIEKIKKQKEFKAKLKVLLENKKAQREYLHINNLLAARDVLDLEILRIKMELEILKLEKIDAQAPNRAMDMASYLKTIKDCLAPPTLFKEPFPQSKNPFKVGWKLEAIDPRHPSLVCVMSVVEVKGYRVKLRFDGYGGNHDFWVNANSPEIFEPGWCERTGHMLTPPRAWEGSFNWTLYLEQQGGIAAPRHAFSHSQDKVQTPSVFRANMKLEAVDMKNTHQICLATIKDVIENRILVHIDGSEDKDDFWVENKSPYIHPCGWCAENGVPLSAQGIEKTRLAVLEGKAVFAPARGFKTRSANDFKVNQKVEAVDKRNPELVRLATIIDVRPHQLRIKFDGWPLQYAYWIDDDSPDIHPLGWCKKTGYPLTDIPLFEILVQKQACPVPGCKGIGHAYRVSNDHSTPDACPYSPQNYLQDNLVPDRFVSNAEYLSVKEISHSKGTKPRMLLKAKSRLLDAKKPSSKNKKTENSSKKVNDKEKGGKQKENDGSGDEARLTKLSKDINSKLDGLDEDARLWSSNEVSLFVTRLLGEGKGEKFEEELLDGEAFLMLDKNDLTEYLEFKFGPAITLYNAIQLLRKMVIDISKGNNAL